MTFASFRTWLLAVCAVALVSCGGGSSSDAGKPFLGIGNGPAGSNVAVSGLVVTLSSPSIPNSGAATATATVTALDANNIALPGAAVTLAADNNAIVTILGDNGSVTDSSGQLQATVGVGADHTNRNITLTATAGAATGKATLAVVDSPSSTVPASIDLIAGATTVGTGGDGVSLTAFVKDANNNALPGVPVAFRASTGTLTGVSAATDSAGVAKATIAAGADRSNRDVTIKVTAGAVTSPLTLPIAGTTLTLQGPSSMILGNTASFDVVAADSKGNVIPGLTVTASSTLGNTLTATNGNVTNSSGLVRYSYTANNAGTDNLVFSGAGASVSPQVPLVVSSLNFGFVSPAPSTTVAVNTAQVVKVQLLAGGAPPPPTTINFAATGGTLSASSASTDAAGSAQVTVTSSSAGPLTVQASVNVGGTVTSTTLPLIVVGTDPANLVLQISPTALAPNLGGATNNQAQVLAKVTDSAGNPVQGKTVNFTRVDDPSGGNLQQVSAITDASGKASATYVSGPQSTANNGVVLQASVAGKPSVSGTASLTVNQAALFIALGTGNVIGNVDPQTYKKDWVVYVTDSNGIAVNAVTLSIKTLPTYYLTGQLAWSTVQNAYVYSSPIWRCRSEDANGNGILDSGEDDNGDGVLWPGNVIAVSPATVQTANGQATISLTYAESFVPWVQVKLTASATVVGTESKTSAEFVVPGDAKDFTVQANPPAGVTSPFGLLPTPAALAKPGACVKIQ